MIKSQTEDPRNWARLDTGRGVVADDGHQAALRIQCLLAMALADVKR